MVKAFISRASLVLALVAVVFGTACGKSIEPATDPDTLGRLSARLEETRDLDSQVELLKQNGHTEETFRKTIEEKMSDPAWATTFSKSYEAEKS